MQGDADDPSASIRVEQASPPASFVQAGTPALPTYDRTTIVSFSVVIHRS
jgi:hypothetical protein